MTVIGKLATFGGAMALQQGAAKVGSYLGLAISSLLVAISLKKIFDIGKKSHAIDQIYNGIPTNDNELNKLTQEIDKTREKVLDLLKSYSSEKLSDEIENKIQQLHDGHLQKTLGQNALSHLLTIQELLYNLEQKKAALSKDMRYYDKDEQLTVMQQETLSQVRDILQKTQALLDVEKTKESLKIMGYVLLIAAGILSIVAPQIFLPFLILFLLGTIIVIAAEKGLLDGVLTRHFEDNRQELFSKKGYENILSERRIAQEKFQEKIEHYISKFSLKPVIEALRKPEEQEMKLKSAS